MILDIEPLNLAEVKEIVKDLEENKEIKNYLKKFGKLDKENAEKLTKQLSVLGNIKLKKEYIAKIIDFLPRDAEDLNKIFQDISLDEKETNEILEIVKQY